LELRWKAKGAGWRHAGARSYQSAPKPGLVDEHINTTKKNKLTQILSPALFKSIYHHVIVISTFGGISGTKVRAVRTPVYGPAVVPGYAFA